MATLIVTDGPACDQQFALAEHGIVLIGRDDECTFQILDDQMSRRHMQVKRRADSGRHEAVDFGSTNGVLVNGRRIDAPVPLVDGDEIRIGATTIVYSIIDAPDAKAIGDLLHKRGEHRRSTMVGDSPEA